VEFCDEYRLGVLGPRLQVGPDGVDGVSPDEGVVGPLVSHPLPTGEINPNGVGIPLELSFERPVSVVAPVDQLAGSHPSLKHAQKGRSVAGIAAHQDPPELLDGEAARDLREVPPDDEAGVIRQRSSIVSEETPHHRVETPLIRRPPPLTQNPALKRIQNPIPAPLPLKPHQTIRPKPTQLRIINPQPIKPLPKRTEMHRPRRLSKPTKPPLHRPRPQQNPQNP